MFAVCGAVALSTAGCGEFFANQSASLGGDRAGSRGEVRVLFINNTDARVVFTYGTFDQFDSSSRPDFGQFLPQGSMVLDAGEQSSLAANSPGSALTCGRVFAIGSERLLSLLAAGQPSGIDEDALVDGVQFVDVATDGEGEETLIPAGAAQPLEALLGVDFPCGALLIVTFEPAVAEGDFRIDFEIIPP